ncbi:MULTISPECIES: ABC transporter permease [Donghicola]|jgi:putative spermidine/putrescine transport system permease protein|uniref:Putative membrane protein n=1 Tax=Donghicola eburneus TaxID=393278 RepID=A0A1M4N527_9RHOB|nr:MULTISPECIES: ABC transporter permease [Donghicola]MCT4578999.1 ABC transporter permease [Donghicola sp.]SCM69055.1 putative membrane protein [Donghicola eburneus]SFQ37021.1 putative spermidine/putrescine transport system permease protein [Donghicola eburneus]
MADTTTDGPMLAADGTPLKQSLARALRRQKIRALMLTAPLLIFVLVSFIMPIGSMLMRSIQNTAGTEYVPDILPNVVAELEEWDPTTGELPSEAAFKAMIIDFQVAFENKQHTQLGRRFNYETPGMSSLFRKSGRKVSRMDVAEITDAKAALLDVDEDWGNLQYWATIKANSGYYTSSYYMAAFDAERTIEGVQMKDPDQRIYQKLMLRTLWLSGLITFCTLAIGYPVAWLLADLPLRTSNLLMILVLLPFWTSLLVRTSAWKILLQEQGVINDIWIALGFSDRLSLINNQLGVVIAMTHILLPFMILPLYSVMKTIPPSYLRAAKSLGATNTTAFLRVYFPQTTPGIGAGALLVFILAVGYFITPELVGGADGTFISNRIYFQFSTLGNWGLAAALGTIMLAVVLLLYYVYDKLVGIDNVKLG